MQISRSAQIYIAGVVSLGACITAYCLWRYPFGGDATFWLLFLAFTVVTALTSRYGLQFSHGQTFHVETIPVFAAILYFNPAAAVLITGLGSALGQIKRKEPVKLVFDVGQALTYVGVSALLLNVFTPIPWMPLGWAAWMGMLAAAAAMYLINTLLVSGVVSLKQRFNFWTVWSAAAEPLSLAAHALMLGFGLLTALVMAPYPWSVALMALPLAAVFVILDRTLRMEAQQKQLAEQNTQLAAHLAAQAEQLRHEIALYQQAEREILQRNKELAALNQIGQALSKLAEPAEIPRLIYDSIGLVLDNHNLYIALYDETNQHLSFPLYTIDGQIEPVGGRPCGNGLTEHVLRAHAPLLISSDLEETARRLGIEPLGRTAQSYLAVPMIVGDKVIGVLAIQDYYNENAYTTAHVELLSTFASQAAIAFENARLFSLLSQEKEQSQVLYRLGRQLTESLDVRQVAQRALDGVCAVVGALRGIVWVRDSASAPDKDRLRFVAISGYDAESVEAINRRHYVRMGMGLVGWVAARRQSTWIDDVTQDERWLPIAGLDDWVRSALSVPLVSGDELVGGISLYSDQPAFFNEGLSHLLESISAPVAVAIANARLYQAEREQYRRLQESQAQLVQAEKMTALGRLVASIAHEINDPLQAVQGCLSLAMEGLDSLSPQDKLMRYLSIAEHEMDRIANIVRRLRDFYRPASQGMQPTDARAVLENVLELAGKQLQNSNVAVERDWGDEALPLIQANPDHLTQVFLSLVLNAIDAVGAQGGRLRVRAVLDEMRSQRHGRMAPAVRVEFSDTGKGMPPETLSHLFEPFFAAKVGGTDLGLSISYGIIQAHHGQITATSEVGAGTTFTIWLPVSEA